MLPAFLEFARGSVLVAHNAPFDVGFLQAAARRARPSPGPAFAVVDTAVLARRVLTRDEVPNCKLATLAALLPAPTTTPNHRALHDARATVDVLHGADRAARQPRRAVAARAARVHRAGRPTPSAASATWPTACRPRPGVYVFRDAQGTPLYVGTSRNLRTRVRQYFVASETRTRMGEMVGLAERVDPIACAHALEAQVRELRLIAAHKPRYNRRSKFPERSVWLKLTDEAFPRLSVVRERRDRRRAPTSARCARSGRPRRCATPSTTPCRCASAPTGCRCAGRCAPPARWPASAGARRRARAARPPSDYRRLVELVAAAWTGDVRPLVEPLQRKLAALSARAALRAGRGRARPDRHRRARLRPHAAAGRADGRSPSWSPRAPTAAAAGSSSVDPARPAGRGRAWPRAASPPWPVIDALLATADVVDAAPRRRCAEETECILRWLEEPGTRLVRASQPWAHAGLRRGRPACLAGRPTRRGARRPVRRPAPRCRSSRRPVRATRLSRRRRRYDGGVITAIVMVSVEADKIPEVAQAIADLDGVSEVYSVAGDVDLIAIVRVREFDQIAEVIAGRLSKVPGVAAHRHPHRLPRLLPPRPRGDVLDRLQLGRLSRLSGRGRGWASHSL